MRCHRARRVMTQALDGELAPRRRRSLDRHLATCPACRAELVTTERLFEALDLLDDEAEVPAPLAHDTLRTVRLDPANAPAPARAWRWGAVLAPALVAAAAVVVMRAGVAPVDEGRLALTAPVPLAAKAPARTRVAERSRRVAPVPGAPPAALAAAPELFIQLPVLRNLEKLEHYDAIRTTTVDAGDDSNG